MRIRRSIAAAAAAALLMALAPAYVSATVAIPGSLDQSVAPGADTYADLSTSVTQTFTAGKSGLLTYIALYCSVSDDFQDGIAITVSIGSSSASATCVDTEEAVDLFFPATPPSVTSGQQYTMTISHGEDQPISLYPAASDYSGGAAAGGDGNPIDGVTDFAFQTYVLVPPTTTYTWNPTSIVAGTSTTVTLTAETDFPATITPVVVPAQGVSPNAPVSVSYLVTLGALPTWFTPTGITCSAQIDPATCTVDNFKAGLTATGPLRAAMSVIVTITGTASPAAAAGGGKGSAQGNGCIPFNDGGTVVNSCGAAEADLTVSAAPATPTPVPTAAPTATPVVTPPPTATDGSGSTGDGSLLLLPGALCFGLGALAVVVRGESRRGSKRL